MTGSDLTQIDGIDVLTAMTILSETGWDMSKRKTEHHFVSWLRLCPDNKISGNKILGKRRLPTNNSVTGALRMAASTLRVSNTYLGAQFRRLRTKLGPPVAIKAMAAKLARLVYRMLRYGMRFVDQGTEFYEAQHRMLQRSSPSNRRPPGWGFKSPNFRPLKPTLLHAGVSREGHQTPSRFRSTGSSGRRRRISHGVVIGVQENSNPTAAASFKRFRPWCVSEPLSGKWLTPPPTRLASF